MGDEAKTKVGGEISIVSAIRKALGYVRIVGAEPATVVLCPQSMQRLSAEAGDLDRYGKPNPMGDNGDTIWDIPIAVGHRDQVETEPMRRTDDDAGFDWSEMDRGRWVPIREPDA